MLPLRRYCPKGLNFAALVIGSLLPDLGYAFGSRRASLLSHGFEGSLGFCLPAGLVLVAGLYLLRRRVVCMLPEPYRNALLPLCQRPSGPPILIVASLLFGIWSHQLFDSMTHEDGWLVGHLTFLRCSLPWFFGRSIKAFALLYAVLTFAGVLWLALDYLGWLEGSLGHEGSKLARTKWIWSAALAGGTLVVAEASRLPCQVVDDVPAAGAMMLLLALFITGTATGMRGIRIRGHR